MYLRFTSGKIIIYFPTKKLEKTICFLPGARQFVLLEAVETLCLFFITSLVKDKDIRMHIIVQIVK